MSTKLFSHWNNFSSSYIKNEIDEFLILAQNSESY